MGECPHGNGESGTRNRSNVDATIAHERIHAEAYIAVLNKFNNPASRAATVPGIPKVGEVFSTLAACQAAQAIWKAALRDAFQDEDRRQKAHCDHLGQPIVTVFKCTVRPTRVVERDGDPYTDSAGVCR